MYTYDSKAEEMLALSEIKYYWLNSNKAVKMFKRLRKEKADYIKETYSTNP